jgi:DNA-binding NarL/FixJ family response regulator
MNDTKILLVDDHIVMRDGLRALLRNHGMTVVGEASTGREAVEMVKQLAPDVVVMDVRMPDLNGFEATRQALAAKPGVKVIALSALNDDNSAIGMVKAGAAGYVAKESAFDDLVTAIRMVISNKVYFKPEIVAAAARHVDSGDDGSAFSALSAREREVLQLIAEGKATKQIAMSLNVSVKTAETHRRNIMEKLRMDSVADLTKYAIRQGLTGV